MVALNILGSRAIGPNGFIDFLLYNIPLGTEKTRWPIYLLVGVAFFFIYYFIFRFLIVKFNFKTVGREDEDQETKLYSKKDYNEKKSSVPADGGLVAPTSDDELSGKIVEGLGGAENIKTIDNCYTRLRLKMEKPGLVNEGLLKNQTQAKGVISNGENVHVVYGLTVPQIREKLEKYLGRDNGGDE